MEKKNIIKVYTTSSGAELSISAPNMKQTINATNNRAQYYAELAKKYKEEAKLHRDNAKYYADQNSNVTFEYIDNVKRDIDNKLQEKQQKGNYALREELPMNLSELNNDSNFVNKTELTEEISRVELPSQEGCNGKVLMSDGTNESWVGINTFQLFDIKISDKILNYTESKGWSLQGTYVYKEALAGSYYGYPDFYTKCLEEYNEATNTETVNGATVKVHSNGHKFYDIADKTKIDNFYDSIGTAWFYGIDTENERVFLPRDKYFTIKGTAPVVGNGMALGLTDGTNNFSIRGGSGQGAGYFTKSTQAYGSNVGTNTDSNSNIAINLSVGVTTDPTKSGLETHLQANEDKYLYICVGNTTNYEGVTDVVNQGIEILEQVNQGIESRVKVDGSNAEFPYIVETYVNGTSGYRIWSDKYCEQWGRTTGTSTGDITVSLLKSYRDTNYNVSRQLLNHTGSAVSTVYLAVKSLSTNSFVMATYASQNAQTSCWKACGYLA